MTATLTPPEAEPTQKPASQRGDRIFAGFARAAGVTIMLALAAVFIFFAARAGTASTPPRRRIGRPPTSSATSAPWSSAPSSRRPSR